MAVHGHTRIELTDVETGETEVVVDKHNALTPLLDHIIHTWSNYRVIYPVTNDYSLLCDSLWKNLFGSMQIFDKPQNPKSIWKQSFNVGGGKYEMSAINGPEAACGPYNAIESEVNVDNKYVKFVWDFSTSQCNGTISSVCLSPYRGHCFNIGTDRDRNAIDNAWLNMAFVSVTPPDPKGVESGDVLIGEERFHLSYYQHGQCVGDLETDRVRLICYDPKTNTRYLAMKLNSATVQVYKTNGKLKSLFSPPHHILDTEFIGECVMDNYGTDAFICGVDVVKHEFTVYTNSSPANFYTINFVTGELVSHYTLALSSSNVFNIPVLESGYYGGGLKNSRVAKAFMSDNCLYTQASDGCVYGYDFIENKQLFKTSALLTGVTPAPFLCVGDKHITFCATSSGSGATASDFAYLIDKRTGEISQAFQSQGWTFAGYGDGTMFMRFSGASYILIPVYDYPELLQNSSSYGVLMNICDVLSTVNNLDTPITKTSKKTMKITYTITES